MFVVDIYISHAVGGGLLKSEVIPFIVVFYVQEQHKFQDSEHWPNPVFHG